MGFRRLLVALAGTLLLVVGPAAPSGSVTTTFTVECSAEDLNGDRRLGPRHLPDWGAVGLERLGHDFGGALGLVRQSVGLGQKG
jgi:hypothetical protein